MVIILERPWGRENPEQHPQKGKEIVKNSDGGGKAG